MYRYYTIQGTNGAVWIRPTYYYQHRCLRHFFAVNRFIIGLKSMVFRLAGSRFHRTWAKASSNAVVPLCCEDHSLLISVWKMNVPQYSWSPQCSWTLWVQFEHWGTQISSCSELFFSTTQEESHNWWRSIVNLVHSVNLCNRLWLIMTKWLSRRWRWWW